MKILVIGPGCAKCKTLAQYTQQAVNELGLTAEVTKVTDLKQIMALGVMMTPALAIDGTVNVVGKVPSIPEIKAILQEAAARGVRQQVVETPGAAITNHGPQTQAKA
jgi:small redox-active disulfide protein 2